MAEAVEFRCVAGKPREVLKWMPSPPVGTRDDVGWGRDWEAVGQSVTVRGPPVRMGGGTGK